MNRSIKFHLLSLSLIGIVAGCATTQYPVNNMQALTVTEQCQGSYWQDCVAYPFPVQYAQVKDGKGVEWQVAYMDEYAGDKSTPETVVLIHGKGVYGGYFGDLMKALLTQGYRVIVPDLPNYGKSILGNLNNPVTRSLDDTRSAIHDLLANKLNIDKASFLGHSMGGQWVMGYALEYPQQVNKIVLEASGGMEEFPTSVAGLPFFGDEQKDSYESWEGIWGSTLKKEKAKTAEDIALFNYFKAKNPKTGVIMDSPSGYFINKTPMTDYVTHARQYMIDNSSKEYDVYAQTYIRDIYSMGVEVRVEDPRSLVKRIDQITAPMLITYGEKEPFIPTTIFSGQQSLRWDVIKPVYDKLSSKGNEPTVVIYPNVGHFIHTDIPEQFHQDVIKFLAGDRISGAEKVSSYKAPLVVPPEEVTAFFDKFKRVLLSQSKANIAAFYADDFVENGYDKSAFLAILYSQMAKVKEYEVSLVKFEKDPNVADEYFIEGMVNLGTISVPFKEGSKVRKTSEGWKWLGNRKS
ncbi:alpha/beta fold hydrolase [Shewanella canadensis]|uniref:Alpha/beta fold hydrolase n=1 Tax=Shewanella canadensis TaxID=271096 RepID=A0A3S0KBR4_9GAMM|nr:alpha/beta fold hydrolase [Shewanella canadensis]RTR39878.1 alpha/beta fold hydrolase [Shewanella canadensis]